MEIKYPLGNYNKEDAYQKIDSFLDGLVNQYQKMIANPQKKWNESKDVMDFGFTAKGFNISGDIKINNNHLILNGKLPFAASFFKGTIERMITEKLDELFVK